MLNKDAVNWAVDFIQNHSDGDLFPKVIEINAISDTKDEFVTLVAGKDLSQLLPGACRRFIVPKDEISYRQATQLDLLPKKNTKPKVSPDDIIKKSGGKQNEKTIHRGTDYWYSKAA